MTDLSTRQYSFNNQAYPQGQQAYGDLPTSYNDKRLDPVKDKTKKDIETNPVVSTAKTFIGEPVNIAIGTVPFLAVDRLLKRISKGEHFSDTPIGKFVGIIDKFSSKMPEFKWIKDKYSNLKDTNFIKQVITAPAAKPRFSLAKAQVHTSKIMTTTHLLDEAAEIGGKSKTIDILKKAIENPEKAENFLKKYAEKCEKNPETISRFERRYGKLLDIKEIKEATEMAKKGNDIYDIAYKKAVKLAGKNPTERFNILKNRAQFYLKKDHSGASKLIMSVYNNMNTFLSVNFGLKAGAKNLGGNAMKILGGGFMLFMGANLLGKIIKDTWNAPKGEKISTLAHGTIADLGSWIMMLPITMFMYKAIGSLKNLKNPEGGSKIIGAIKAPFRWAGKFLNTGLETPKARGMLNWRKIPHAIKRVGGGTMRFLMFAMVLTPIVDKMLKGASHSIFGTPNALIAKEKAEEEAEKAKSEGTTNNEDALKKALEQNKAGMLTVNAKTTQNTANPMIEKHLKAQTENINKTAEANTQSKISDVNSELNKLPETNTNVSTENPFEQHPRLSEKKKYSPSETKKISQEDAERKIKIDAALAATDKMILNADKELGAI